MEKTSALTTLHWQTWATFTIYIFDRDPIGQRILRHETLEIHFWHSISCFDIIQVFSTGESKLCHLHIQTLECGSHIPSQSFAHEP